MGKQGPCRHCGVTSTPLWRNGPPEKPVLCNACGSRWRTKGTLVNYTPLHARAEPDEFEDYRVQRVKTISLKNKESKFLKRKQSYNSAVGGGIDPDYNQSSRKSLDEDTSNRSSSGSAISNSESCVQFGGADASDFTDPAQSVVWESMVPSKKRTCVLRTKPSPMEILTKDLYTILHEQQSQSSYFSGSSEEDLLFESDTPMVSVEIGHGSVLIRHPSSIAKDEESEASSLSFDNKIRVAEEAHANLITFPVHKNKGANFASLVNRKSNKLPAGQGMQNEQNKRDKAQLEILQILGNHNSPLRYVDLKDVLDFEGFASHLTNEEQKQLLKYLPPIDSARLPDSLECMFGSPHFKENLSSFQKLLAEGVFDFSMPERTTEECRTLKRLALCNATKSKWVEQYNIFKNLKCSNDGGPTFPVGSRSFASGSSSANIKRSGDSRFLNSPGPNMRMKSPKIVMKGGYEHKELMDNDGSCFSPRSLFALPPDDSSSLVLDSLQFAEEGNSDQDLLLDVPSNSYFPQAELLSTTTKFQPSDRR